MSTESTGHVPVLLRETMEALAPQPGEIAVDCTVGRGGHTEALARALGPTGRVIGFDVDAGNLAYAAERLRQPDLAPFTGLNENFAGIGAMLEALGVKPSIVLADLGFSSNQVDDPARGLSFSDDGPLDMRLDPRMTRTAADLVNELSEGELADVIFHLGEDPFARRIARKLAQTRRIEPIRTTSTLARLVREAYGPRARTSRMHPATRTFMALRIAVNDELRTLERLLAQVIDAATRASEDRGGWLAPGARVAIIGFHSLEDRLVKTAFVDLERRGLATRHPRKAIFAGPEETATNPRSRSARLRCVMVGAPTSRI